MRMPAKTSLPQYRNKTDNCSYAIGLTKRARGHNQAKARITDDCPCCACETLMDSATMSGCLKTPGGCLFLQDLNASPRPVPAHKIPIKIAQMDPTILMKAPDTNGKAVSIR